MLEEKSQSKRFEDKACKLDVELDEDELKEALRMLASEKPPPKPNQNEE